MKKNHVLSIGLLFCLESAYLNVGTTLAQTDSSGDPKENKTIALGYSILHSNRLAGSGELRDPGPILGEKMLSINDPSAIRLEIDGHAIPVTGIDSRAPVAMGIFLDVSPSMGGRKLLWMKSEGDWPDIKDGVLAGLRRLILPADSYLVGTLNGGLNVLKTWDEPMEKAVSQIEALPEPQAHDIDPYGSLLSALDYFNHKPGRKKIMLLITDGQMFRSLTSEMRGALVKSGVQFYPMVIWDGIPDSLSIHDIGDLESLAEISGGEVLYGLNIIPTGSPFTRVIEGSRMRLSHYSAKEIRAIIPRTLQHLEKRAASAMLLSYDASSLQVGKTHKVKIRLPKDVEQMAKQYFHPQLDNTLVLRYPSRTWD